MFECACLSKILSANRINDTERRGPSWGAFVCCLNRFPVFQNVSCSVFCGVHVLDLRWKLLRRLDYGKS